jgi:PiT family inorganic phosphate transporter
LVRRALSLSIDRRQGDDPGVTDTAVLLALVVVTALAFDFTNGFHDTANAMATSVATGALRPRWLWPCPEP